MTAVGFEPTPFRNGALNHRLRRLGQTVVEGSKTYEFFGENRPTCSKEKGATQDICNENYRTHSSVGQSVWLTNRKVSSSSLDGSTSGVEEFLWWRTPPAFHLFRKPGPAKPTKHSQDTVFEFRRRLSFAGVASDLKQS